MSNKFIFGIGCLTALGALFLMLGIAMIALGVASTAVGAVGGAVIYGALFTGIGAGILAMVYLLVRRHPPAAGDEGENKTPQPPAGIQNVPRPPGAQQ